MSFILDALKKSENERQRYNGPSLVDTPMRREPNERPWWAIGLAALLGLNLLVFAFVLLRPTANEPAAPAPAQTAPAPPSATPAPTPTPIAAAPALAAPQVQDARSRSAPVARDPAVRSLADEAGVPDPFVDEPIAPNRNPDLAAAARVPDGPPLVQPIQGPSAARVQNNAPPPPARNEVLPTINDLTAGGSSQVPPMHLDIHVYSTSPAERFVFINMRKYREGEALSEGPVVERIDRDGVVMNHRGLRFLMPRQ